MRFRAKVPCTVLLYTFPSKLSEYLNRVIAYVRDYLYKKIYLYNLIKLYEDCIEIFHTILYELIKSYIFSYELDTNGIGSD